MTDEQIERSLKRRRGNLYIFKQGRGETVLFKKGERLSKSNEDW